MPSQRPGHSEPLICQASIEQECNMTRGAGHQQSPGAEKGLREPPDRFVVAITYPFPPLFTFGSIPVLTYVLFRVAQGPAYNDPFGRRDRGPAFPARGQSIVFRPASFDLRGREPVFPPGTSQFAVRQHPLWDRWIDG